MISHTLSNFDRDLNGIRTEINVMADNVQFQCQQALQALLNHDASIAEAVVAKDALTNQSLKKIEGHSTNVLARQQAVADDLRFILCSMRIAPHLERIGDYAKSTALKSEHFPNGLPAQWREKLERMQRHLLTMFDHVMQSYNSKNLAQAGVVYEGDDTLDVYYQDIYTSLIDTIRQGQGSTTQWVELLFIAKNFERAGDHIKDISRDVQFMIRGNLT